LIDQKNPAIQNKISFKSLDIFYDQIGKTRAATGRAAMIAQHCYIINLLYCTPDLTMAVPPGVGARVNLRQNLPIAGRNLHTLGQPDTI
jgi:hypothetical protein